MSGGHDCINNIILTITAFEKRNGKGKPYPDLLYGNIDRGYISLFLTPNLYPARMRVYVFCKID